MNTSTERFIQRATVEWSNLVGLPIDVREIGGQIYALGSELAILRLANKFKSFEIDYSVNLSRERKQPTWFYRHELKF